MCEREYCRLDVTLKQHYVIIRRAHGTTSASMCYRTKSSSEPFQRAKFRMRNTQLPRETATAAAAKSMCDRVISRVETNGMTRVMHRQLTFLPSSASYSQRRAFRAFRNPGYQVESVCLRRAYVVYYPVETTKAVGDLPADFVQVILLVNTQYSGFNGTMAELMLLRHRKLCVVAR